MEPIAQSAVAGLIAALTATAILGIARYIRQRLAKRRDVKYIRDGIELQVGQVPQLCWTDAVVAQAFHDAADFRRGSQGAVGSAQRAGSGRRGPTGDDISPSWRTCKRPSVCSRTSTWTPA